MIRVGILGYSNIARRKFIPALLKSGRARLVALASRQRNVTASPNDGLPAEWMMYHELVSDPAIDLIYISLPNHLHEEWSIRALEQGRHVICEKPLGLNTASVNRMLEAADRHGRLLYENLMYLQHPQHALVKTFIENGRIGRVVSLHSEFAFPGPAAGDFRLDPFQGGGAFHDMNRYPLSAALNFLEGKQHRFTHGSIDVQNGLTRSLQGGSLTDCGERFTFMTAFEQPYRSFYKIEGTRGTIRVDRAYTTPADMGNRIATTVDSREGSFDVPPFDHFLGTIDHVCGLIRSGTWSNEHLRSRELAGLADMFLDGCLRKENGHETG